MKQVKHERAVAPSRRARRLESPPGHRGGWQPPTAPLHLARHRRGRG